jgi:hypothetical protein
LAQVFISYTREDRLWAERLDSALRAQGFSTWWDTSLVAGESWGETIRSELQQAHIVVVLWSRSSWASRWVQAEAHAAFARDAMISALVDDVSLAVPFNVGQAVDLREFDKGIGSLVQGIRKRLEPALPSPISPYKIGQTWKSAPKRVNSIAAIRDFETFELKNGCQAVIEAGLGRVAVLPYKEPFRIWDVATQDIVFELPRFEGGYRCGGFAEGGARFISLGRDGWLRLFDLDSGKEIARSRADHISSEVFRSDTSFSPSGRLLRHKRYGESKDISLYDVATGKCVWTKAAPITSFVLDESESKCACCPSETLIEVSRVDLDCTMTVIASYRCPEAAIPLPSRSILAANRSLTKILVDNEDPTENLMTLVDGGSGSEKTFACGATAATMSDDGSVLVAADLDGWIRVFDPDQHKPTCKVRTRLLDGNKMNRTMALAMNQHASEALSVDEFGVVTCWSLQS